jgi:hypothetical protein
MGSKFAATMREIDHSVAIVLLVFVWDFGFITGQWMVTNTFDQWAIRTIAAHTYRINSFTDVNAGLRVPDDSTGVQVVFCLGRCAAISRIFYGADFGNSGNRIHCSQPLLSAKAYQGKRQMLFLCLMPVNDRLLSAQKTTDKNTTNLSGSKYSSLV